MAVRLNPCFGCPVKALAIPECAETRDRMRKGVSGLGLRSATFNCPVLASKLHKGARVVITVPIFTGHGYDGDEICDRRDAHATVTSANGSKFACIIDLKDAPTEDEVSESVSDIAKLRFRKTMRHSRIKAFLDEPDREVCALGNVLKSAGAPFSCERKEGTECSCFENALLSAWGQPEKEQATRAEFARLEAPSTPDTGREG